MPMRNGATRFTEFQKMGHSFSGGLAMEKLIRLTVIVSLLLLIQLSFSQDKWQIFSDYRDVREICYLDGKIWCATSGGLASFDIARNEYRYFTPIDGMAGVGVSAMISDEQNGLWLAFDNIALQRFEPGKGITHTTIGIDRRTGLSGVNDLTLCDEGMFLATDRGVVRVTYSEEYDRWAALEEWTKMGEFEDDLEAKRLTVNNNFVWIGTEAGIARADLDSPPPRDWENYTTDNGLPGNEIRDLAKWNGSVYAASDGGVSVWNGANWSLASNAKDIRKLGVVHDTLRAVRDDGVYTFAADEWRRETPAHNRLSSFAWDGDDNIWGGMMFSGSASYRGGLVLAADTAFVEFAPNGPPSDRIQEFGFTSEGEALFAARGGSGRLGVGIWDGNTWEIYTRPKYTQRIFSYAIYDVTEDFDGGIWFSAWGGGLARINPDKTISLYDYSEATGQRLIGFRGSLDYVLAPDIELDNSGNLWVTNRGADNGNVLVCVPRSFIQDPDPDRDWIYFHRTLFRNFPHFDRLAIDGQGRKWLASLSPEVIDGKGVYAFDDNGTLDDPADDRVWGPFPGLESPQVLSLAYDPDGYIWAGTIDGAYYLNTNFTDLNNQGFTPLYPMRDHQINDIEIDAAGNKWFGTTFGVFVVADDLFTVKRQITTDKPDMLPDLNVNSLGINPQTGWAYMGTNYGTAALLTPYRNYGTELIELTFEPNPFNPNNGRLIFTGNSLANMADAKIYTPDGRIVRSLNHEEAAFGWDGLNESGYKVASGVYLIVTHTDDGKAAKGKVAVIWSK